MCSSERTRPQHQTFHRKVRVNNLSIFYREAGPANAPALLLLHGFPSSSRMYKPLLDRLSDRFRQSNPCFTQSFKGNLQN